MASMEGGSSRVDRRRAATRARILAEAARRFAEEGFDSVRLDAVADAADVARGTLYSHFPTKDDLGQAIVRPVLERALRGVAGLSALPPREGVRGLFRLYVELYRDFGDALRLSYQMQSRPLGELAALHGEFMRGALGVLDRAARAGLLRTGDAALSARALARAAIPLLELYAGRADAEALFMESMEGLLLRG
jgi:AcrR family transcriptional regulator